MLDRFHPRMAHKVPLQVSVVQPTNHNQTCLRKGIGRGTNDRDSSRPAVRLILGLVLFDVEVQNILLIVQCCARILSNVLARENMLFDIEV